MQSILLTARNRGDNKRYADVLAMLWNSVVVWRHRARQRHSLAELDRHMLADIGLSPADRDVECAKPFWLP